MEIQIGEEHTVQVVRVGKRVYVVLSQGIKVLMGLYTEVWTKVEAAIPRLPRHRKLKVDDFFDPSYWRGLHTSEHWLIGCMLAHWVRSGMLPLELLGCESCSKLRYQRQ